VSVKEAFFVLGEKKSEKMEKIVRFLIHEGVVVDPLEFVVKGLAEHVTLNFVILAIVQSVFKRKKSHIQRFFFIQKKRTWCFCWSLMILANKFQNCFSSFQLYSSRNMAKISCW